MIFSQKIKEGHCVGCYWHALGSEALVEFSADAEVEAVVLDAQHGLWERKSMENAIGIVRSHCHTMVRVADNDRYSIGSALDAGAEVVIVPLIETAGEAAKAVSLAKYPPVGVRSGGGVRPLKDFGTYADMSVNDSCVVLMIETARAVENFEEIVAVPGVDMFFIGTGDLSLSLGIAMSDPEMEGVVLSIRDRCKAAGMPVGIFTGGTDVAINRRDQGFQLVVIGDDISMSRSSVMNARIGFGS